MTTKPEPTPLIMRGLRSIVCSLPLWIVWLTLTPYYVYDWQTFIFITGVAASGVIRDSWEIR